MVIATSMFARFSQITKIDNLPLNGKCHSKPGLSLAAIIGQVLGDLVNDSDPSFDSL